MKLSTNRYSVKFNIGGVWNFDGYYGYTNQKDAMARVNEFKKIGIKAVIIDNKSK